MTTSHEQSMLLAEVLRICAKLGCDIRFVRSSSNGNGSITLHGVPTDYHKSVVQAVTEQTQSNSVLAKMSNHLGLDGWQAWDYALARLYKRTETAEGICIVCDVCGSPNGKMHGKTCPISVAEALISCELRKCQAGHRKLVVYIAGRFRAKDGWLINENVFAAERAGRSVARLGGMPLVPHSIGAHMAGTEDDSFWLTGTLELMRRCDLVLVLPGWEDSQGARGEIAEAERIGLPVIFPANGIPNWTDLRAWLEKPQVSATFNGQPVQMAGRPKPQMAEAAQARQARGGTAHDRRIGRELHLAEGLSGSAQAG